MADRIVSEDAVEAAICRLAEDPEGSVARLNRKLREVRKLLNFARRSAFPLPRDHVRALEQAERGLRFELLLAEGIRDDRVRRVPGARGELSWAIDGDLAVDAFSELGG